MWVYGLDWAGPGQRQVADACECGNEPLGSVKYGEFLDQLQTSQLLKKDSAPWSKLVSINVFTACNLRAQVAMFHWHIYSEMNFQNLSTVRLSNFCRTARREIAFISAETFSHPHIIAPDYREIICKKMWIVSTTREPHDTLLVHVYMTRVCIWKRFQQFGQKKKWLTKRFSMVKYFASA